MSRLILIDYGSGNVHSADRALNEAAQRKGVTVDVVLTADAEEIRRADRIVLPGVGHFQDCMNGLKARDGLIAALEEAVIERAVPFLGICVGMQLLADSGLEDGEHAGLGWIGGRVEPLAPSPEIRIPHMGWNSISRTGHHALLEGLGDDAHMYFVHSYAFTTGDPQHVLATSQHGESFAAVVGRNNIAGTQFHPEKSQTDGLRFLSNFLTWAP